MKTNIFKAFAIVTILAVPFMLSGCQKKCPKPEQNIPGTSTFRSDCPVTTPQASGQRRELDFYFVFDDTDAFQEQIQAFQSKNPGVIVRTKKFVNLDEYKKEVVSEIADGEGPDVFMIQNTWMPEFAKKLLPMPKDLPVTMTPEVFRQTFFQAAADQLVLDDQYVMGMPLSLDNLAVYYNKQVMKDLLATKSEPGALWEEIKDQAFNLTKRDNSPERFALAGIALGRSDNITSAVDVLLGMMVQFGTKFYDEKEENAIFALPQNNATPGVDALTLFTSFAIPSYKNYSWNETITGYAPAEKDISPFARGKVAMILGYPYLYDAITQSIENLQKKGEDHMDIKDIGVAPFPQLVSPEVATSRDTIASYFPLVVSRNTQLSADAWNFVQFMTTADALQTYHKKTNRPTSRKDMVQDQQTEPIFGVFAYQAPFAKSLTVFDDAAYKKIFGDAIQQVVRNVASPRDALMDAQTKVTCLIKKEKGLVGTETDCKI